MTTISFEESNLRFQFKEGLLPIKFDETNFYTNRFNTLTGSKGVDFIRLKWLTTKVFVENVQLSKGHIYTISRLSKPS
ncbi:hypothetical protein [Paenibacillus sp. NPDC055715]